jgi:hypothetical protein
MCVYGLIGSRENFEFLILNQTKNTLVLCLAIAWKSRQKNLSTTFKKFSITAK